MADFTLITTGKGKFLVVKVPDVLRKYILENNILYFVEDPLDHCYTRVDLPPGYSYTFLFCTKEVTEQQAGEVCESRDELNTLLLAHGLNQEDNFAFLKVNE